MQFVFVSSTPNSSVAGLYRTRSPFVRRHSSVLGVSGPPTKVSAAIKYVSTVVMPSTATLAACFLKCRRHLSNLTKPFVKGGTVVGGRAGSYHSHGPVN